MAPKASERGHKILRRGLLLLLPPLVCSLSLARSLFLRTHPPMLHAHCCVVLSNFRQSTASRGGLFHIHRYLWVSFFDLLGNTEPGYKGFRIGCMTHCRSRGEFTQPRNSLLAISVLLRFMTHSCEKDIADCNW